MKNSISFRISMLSCTVDFDSLCNKLKFSNEIIKLGGSSESLPLVGQVKKVYWRLAKLMFIT
jgi:hypothetical protein